MIGRFDSTMTSNQKRRSLRALGLVLLATAAAILTWGAAGLAQAQTNAPRANQRPSTPDPGEPQPLPDLGSTLPPPIPPGGMALPSNKTRDPKVEPADTLGTTLGDEQNTLPAAIERPGGLPPAKGSGAGAGGEPDPIVLSPEKMSNGRQRVQLSVEVQAGTVINLGKESTVKLVVVNEGVADAYGVSVLYQLPEGLEIVSSLPEGTQDSVNKSLYYYKKSMLAGGNEWTIVLKVKANAVRPCEHSASVTAKAGSRASTIIQEPKLKVEATATPGRVLKGAQVTFQITVTNPGSGPARNVTVQAKLSSGLKHESDDLVEQTIEVIKPGERVELEPLTVDTVAGGQQSCTVDVRSLDVNAVPEDARVIRNIEVTKADLLVKLSGQESRYTGQDNEYKLTVSNPGSAPAKKIRIIATMPSAGGALKVMPDKAGFDKTTRKLSWLINQLEPGGSMDLSFIYGTSTPGLYVVTAEATSGELHSTDRFSTDVSGIAVLDLQITQTNKVIDVGKSTFYDITIKNVGTKEATRLQLSGDLTNLLVKAHFNVEKGQFQFKPDTGAFVFPEVDRLAPGQTIVLSLEVQANKAGPAGAHVRLAHAEMEPNEKVEDVIATKVTGNAPRTTPR